MNDSMHTATTYSEPVRARASDRLFSWLARHWLLAFGVGWGLYVGLPWLAPVFMRIGAIGPAAALYAFYSTQCHQLPERSYFLFGQQFTYTLSQIQAAFLPTNRPEILRQFIGNPEMGWKVAWSDRMVSLHTAILLGAFLYSRVRNTWRRLPLWLFVLLLMPMAVDGLTHMASDVLGGGVGLGFRDTNAWLAALTGYALPAGFYAGDALGSFNSLMRLVTGVLAGLAIVGFAFPYIDAAAFDMMRDELRRRRPAVL